MDRREIKKKARSRTQLPAKKNYGPLITLHTALDDFPDDYYFVVRKDPRVVRDRARTTRKKSLKALTPIVI